MGILQSPLSVTLSPPKPLTKSNQSWCVSCSHEWGMQWHNFFCPAPGEGPKGQLSLSLSQKHFKSISKIFKPNFVCLLTNERYKIYQTEFHSAAWVMPKGWDLGYLGDGGQKVFFPKFNYIW